MREAEFAIYPDAIFFDAIVGAMRGGTDGTARGVFALRVRP
jgi:hypothetical protein